MNDEKPKMGRPTIFSEELAGKVLDRMAGGESVRQICRDESMPCRTTVMKWRRENEQFASQYARAREAMFEFWEDEQIEIADDGTNDWIDREMRDGRIERVLDAEHVKRSELRINARRWIMSRLHPKKYGDRIHQEVTGKDGAPIQYEDARDRNLRSIEALSARLAGATAGEAAGPAAGAADSEPDAGGNP